jgi:hypothetical protein
MVGCRYDSFGSTQGQLAGCCELQILIRTATTSFSGRIMALISLQVGSVVRTALSIKIKYLHLWHIVFFGTKLYGVTSQNTVILKIS